MHAWMGNGQRRAAQGRLSMQQQIEIQRARRIVQATFASVDKFDSL
jgi:hypothetical protein